LSKQKPGEKPTIAESVVRAPAVNVQRDKGPGVRASTIAKEPGSTNINFLLQQQQTQVVLPQKRYGHSATVVDNKLYVFGGAFKKGNGNTFHSFYEC
jgi:hypothetical protein